MISKDRSLNQKQIYNFLRSATIKFSPVAEYLNATVERNGRYVNNLDPASWKYYQNIQGLYHESDTLMYVTSLDTQDRILFATDVLVDHPRTRSVYVPGGLYYQRLCDLYPEQVDLIKSILFPVTDVTKAIAADDLTLLGYSSGYLEEYEEEIIVMEVEKFLGILRERWYFDFLKSEPYYDLTFWSSLWFWLAGLISVTRENLVHTPYVHSWHLWNELKAKGLDNYSDVLDRRKSMMLYQNIDYFKANAGKQGNLLILAERLLSDFEVSIYSRQVVEEAETNEASFELTPQLRAVRITNKNRNTVGSEIASVPVSVIQSQVFEKGLTQSNSEESARAIERRLGDTTLNRFMSKFLEIRPITRNKSYADILNVFLMETLTTSIIRGYYNVPVKVEDQATGFNLFLYPKELLAIYHYAVMRSLGITPDEIPTKVHLYKSFLPDIPTPSKSILYGDELLYISQHFDANTFFDDMAYDRNITTPDNFSTMLTRQWLAYLTNVVEDQNTLIERRRYILQYLTSLCHSRRTETVDLIPGYTSYKEWFGNGGIDIINALIAQYELKANSLAAWGSLADAIMSALVPITDTLSYFGNYTLSDFGYSRLRQLFVQMCSYRVVFLESSRATAEFSIGAKWSTRYGPDHTQTYSDRTIVRYVRTVDKENVKTEMVLYPGFWKQLKAKTLDVRKYTVTTVAKKLKDQINHAGDRPSFTMGITGNNTTQGALCLGYSGMQAIFEREETNDPVLIDSDKSILRDSDDSILTDKPS